MMNHGVEATIELAAAASADVVAELLGACERFEPRLFELRPTTVKVHAAGKPIPTELFEELAAQPQHREVLLRFVRQVAAWNRTLHTTLWEGDEYPLGSRAVKLLALADVALVHEYIEFLRPLDHGRTAYEHEAIEEVIRRHGWREETVALFAMGAHNYSDLGMVLADEGFAEYNRPEERRVKLREALWREARLSNAHWFRALEPIREADHHERDRARAHEESLSSLKWATRDFFRSKPAEADQERERS